MRALLQRVNRASVGVENEVIGEIEKGILIFLGVTLEDTEKDAEFLAEKIVNLRIFANETGKFDASVMDIKGEVLVISQFTLYADCRKGRRPDFTDAARPELAEKLYKKFVQLLQEKGVRTAFGKFGAYMQVELENDGPVTILLDSAERR